MSKPARVVSTRLGSNHNEPSQKGHIMAKADSTAPTLTAKDILRFWSKVKQGEPNECWLWQTGRFDCGYGQFYLDHRSYPAHVIARWISTKQWPGKLFTCHNCPGGDNPLCVNPAHLWLGTHAENMADAKRKGQMPTGDRNGLRLHPEKVRRGEEHHSYLRPDRVACGERCRNTKLTEGQVREIRVLHAAGGSLFALGKQFGVNPHTIWNLVTRKTWKHVLP